MKTNIIFNIKIRNNDKILYAKLFHKNFPKGVENLLNIAKGITRKKQKIGRYNRETIRNFDNYEFYGTYNKYMICNNSNTIYNDEKILFEGIINKIPEIGDIYLISENNYYDSSFLIVLNNIELPRNYIHVGKIQNINDLYSFNYAFMLPRKPLVQISSTKV